MRFGGWYRIGRRGGVFVGTTLPRHAKRHAARLADHTARHPVRVGGCLVWLCVLALIAVMLIVR